MATDYKIVEDEMGKELNQLRRDLHMKGVKSLSRKHYGLAKKALQRKLVNILTEQMEELVPTVNVIYNPNNKLKDNEIKGYLIYLLHLEDFFVREVKTKKEIIQQREEQIKKLLVKLCAMRNEYAKKKRALPTKAPEFTQLENMSNKMNQIEKRICSLQHESKGIRERILDMRIFQRQYKDFEKEFRAKIKKLTEEAEENLFTAVETYKSRKDFITKKEIYQQRCAQDLKKAAVNENALNMILEKIDNFEEFAALQDQVRTDSRIAVTGDLIEKGETGLEPKLRDVEKLHGAIVSSSGRTTPEQMEDYFKLTEDQTRSVFSHLDELLKDIHHTQNTVNELRTKNTVLLKGMSTQERRLRWEITENQRKARACTKEADTATAIRNQAREELDVLLKRLSCLYRACISEETPDGDAKRPESEIEGESSLDEVIGKREDEKEDGQSSVIRPPVDEIDDANALDFSENIEKKILEYLMVVEYLRSKELRVEETPENIIGMDDDTPIIEEPPKLHHLDTIQPRLLESETNLDIGPILDLEKEESVLSLEELKPTAMEMVAEIESGDSTEEDDTNK